MRRLRRPGRPACRRRRCSNGSRRCRRARTARTSRASPPARAASVRKRRSSACSSTSSLPDDHIQRRRMTFSDTSRIIHAVEYLLAIATEKNLPLVVNISLGTNGGAHDGSSGVSRWLDAYLAAPGRAICVAAGNAGQEKAQTEGDLGWIMGRIHSQGRVPARGPRGRARMDGRRRRHRGSSENELEIWYGSQDRFHVAVQPPGTSDWISVNPREFVENHRLASGTTLSIYNELYHPTNGANYIAVYLSPNLDAARFPRHSGRRLEGAAHGRRRARRPVQRVDRTRRSRGARAGGRPPVLPVPVVLHRGDATPTHIRSARWPAGTASSRSRTWTRCGSASTPRAARARRATGATSRKSPRRARTSSRPTVFRIPDQPWIAMTRHEHGQSRTWPASSALMLGANRGLSAAQCAGILLRTARPLPGACV